MWSFIGYMLLFVAFFETCYGLTCYQCRSSRVSDCTTNDLNQKMVSCGPSHPDLLQFCIFKVVYDIPLQSTVATSSCETVQKSPMQNWQTIERDFCQSGYSQQVHQCRICLSDLCNNPTFPYLQNAAPGPAPYATNYVPGQYYPNTGPGTYGYIPSPPRPPQTYGGLYYRSTAATTILINSPYVALGLAAIIHLLTN